MRKTHPKWKSRVHRGRKRKTRNFERKRYAPNEDPDKVTQLDERN